MGLDTAPGGGAEEGSWVHLKLINSVTGSGMRAGAVEEDGVVILGRSDLL